MKTLITMIYFFIREFFLFMKEKPVVIEEVIPELEKPAEKPIEKPVEKPVVHSKAWCGGSMEERRAMFQMAQRVCKEENVSHEMTLDILATIWGESGFNQWCVNEQTKDYGICQFSERYYLKEYKMTPEDTFNNPEKCVRIMARNFKAGRANNWIAYKGGSYKKWLGRTL
jgi:hypothetical protein